MSIMLHGHSARSLWQSRGYAKAATEYLLKTSSSHYQILNVPPNASSPDIRAAFVKISKQVHPDKNPDDPRTHHKFVRLNEAYTVLSNPKRRRAYDNQLVMMRLSQQNVVNNVYSTHTSGENYSYTPGADGERFYWDERTWTHRRDTRNTKAAPETDFFRSSNGRAVIDCCLIMLAGVGLFFYGLRASNKEADKLLKRSNDNLAVLHKMRNDARINGPQKRFEQYQDLMRKQPAELKLKARKEEQRLKARREAALASDKSPASANSVKMDLSNSTVTKSASSGGVNSKNKAADLTSSSHQSADSASAGPHSAAVTGANQNQTEKLSYL